MQFLALGHGPWPGFRLLMNANQWPHSCLLHGEILLRHRRPGNVIGWFLGTIGNGLRGQIVVATKPVATLTHYSNDISKATIFMLD